MHEAIEGGITFFDNCWDYNQGASEERMGKALKDGYRQRVFLMTKLDGRTAQAASAQLEQSLQRLQTDVIDLVQVHEVIRMTDPARAFARGRRDRRATGRKEGRQAASHRLHRSQGSRDSLGHAGSRAARRLQLRHRANAAQRDGRSLQELRKERVAGAPSTRHRRARHEIDGLGRYPEERRGASRTNACATRSACRRPS